jgi:hypothetical protein
MAMAPAMTKAALFPEGKDCPSPLVSSARCSEPVSSSPPPMSMRRKCRTQADASGGAEPWPSKGEEPAPQGNSETV